MKLMNCATYSRNALGCLSRLSPGDIPVIPAALLFLAVFFLLSWQLPAQEFTPNHPELKWETIETEHFLVHYHQGTVRTANIVADIAEEVHPHITALYRYEPGSKVEFIIRDTDDYANGAAYFFDNKVEIWAENLDYILRGTHNWLRDVVTHEYTHIISLQKALKFGRRIPAGWFQVFGYEDERRPDVVRGFPNTLISYPISGVTIPVWYAEGVAQYQTSTKRFDYRDSHREMILRDRVMTGNLLDLDEMGTFGKNSIGNESSYNQGFSFVKFLAESYGDTVLTELAAQAGHPLTLSFESVLKKVTGAKAEELHTRWHTRLKETYTQRLKVVQENLQTGKPFVEKGIGNLFPTVSPDGKMIAYLATGDADYLLQNALIVEDLQSGKKLSVSGNISSSISWSPDNRYLAYAKLWPDPRTQGRFNDLFIYDIEKEKEYRLTRTMRARNPDWSHEGNRLVFVVESDGLTNLFTIDLGEVGETLANKKSWKTLYYDLNSHTIVETLPPEKRKHSHYYYRKVEYRGARIRQLTQADDGRQFYHPRWSPDDSYIVFDTSVKFGRDIARIPAAGGELTFILNNRCDERYPVFHRQTGRLYFASDQTGIFNIYCLDPQTGEQQAYTNVIGGAFMPFPEPNGNLYYSQYVDQGYKIYKINPPRPLPAEYLTYLEDYESRIPEIEANRPLKEPLPSTAYKNRFPGVSLMPRLFVDYGTVKPGLYIYTNELLNRLLFFGGFDFNFRKDYDLFGIFEFNLWKPTFFIEGYNQTSNIKDDIIIEGYNTRPEADVNFNLLEFDLGLRGHFLPGKLEELFYAQLKYVFSLYRARIGAFSFTDPATGQLFVSDPFRYTYLRGHALSLSLRYDHVQRDTDTAINARNGRVVRFKIQRQWNQFLDDFASDRVVALEEFKQYNYNQYELDWEEFLSIPFARRHSLTLRFQGGLIDAPVDSFFHLFAGGLPGLKGYPYYAVEGRRMAIGTVTYRLPLWRNINTQILNMYFDKLYLGAYFQYGNAWSENELNFDDFLSTVGAQLRLETFSWYFFPTRIFFEAAYPLKEQFNSAIRYQRDWRFYVGILFDFDIRLDKKFFGR